MKIVYSYLEMYCHNFIKREDNNRFRIDMKYFDGCRYIFGPTCIYSFHITNKPGPFLGVSTVNLL